MEIAKKSFLDLYRDARDIFGDENIDSLSEYLKSVQFQKESFYSMTPFKKKVYDYHLEISKWEYHKRSIYDSYDIAHDWGLLMEWAISKGYKISEIAEVTLDILKAFSKAFSERFRLYLPFMILVSFWDRGDELYLLGSKFFDHFDDISNHINDMEFGQMGYIKKMLSNTEAEIDKEIQDYKLLESIKLDYWSVRNKSTNKLLREFEFKRPKAIKKLHFKLKMFFGKNNGQDNCHRDALEVAILIQRNFKMLIFRTLGKELDSLKELFQITVKYYENDTIPDILDEFWKYSDQVNC